MAEASSGAEALQRLKQEPYHLVILDLRLPDMDGLDILKETVQINPDIAFVILTGHGTLQSAIAAAKSDVVVDYLLKPARNEEIIKAVNQACRKQRELMQQRRLLAAAGNFLDVINQPDPLLETPLNSAPYFSLTVDDQNRSADRFIVASPLILDCHERIVALKIGDSTKRVELSKAETAVLSTLMAHPGRVLSCKELVAKSYGYDAAEFEAKNIIRPLIRRLRQKIEPNPQESEFINTVRRRGYRLSLAQS